MLQKIKVFVISEEELVGTKSYRCHLFFEGSDYGYSNILSRDTIMLFEQQGVTVERV